MTLCYDYYYLCWGYHEHNIIVTATTVHKLAYPRSDGACYGVHVTNSSNRCIGVSTYHSLHRVLLTHCHETVPCVFPVYIKQQNEHIKDTSPLIARYYQHKKYYL